MQMYEWAQEDPKEILLRKLMKLWEIKKKKNKVVLSQYILDWFFG